MGGMVKNLAKVGLGVELEMQKTRDLAAGQYRQFVWDVFLRILKETPQFSGAAVANWNVSLNGPNFDFDPNLGTEVDPIYGTELERGDDRWINVAKRRNQAVVWGPGGGPRLGFKRGGLSYKDRAYITNGVRGDTDDGKSLEAYMESLQDPAYAARKLRDVNQVYENAQESVIIVSSKYLSRGISLPTVGGESFI